MKSRVWSDHFAFPLWHGHISFLEKHLEYLQCCQSSRVWSGGPGPPNPGDSSSVLSLYLPLVFEVWDLTSNMSLKPQQLHASLSFKLNLKSSQSHSLKSQAIKKIYTTRPIKSEELASLWLPSCSPVNHSRTGRKSNCSVFLAFFCLHFPTEVFQVAVDCFSQNLDDEELQILVWRCWARLVSHLG